MEQEIREKTVQITVRVPESISNRLAKIGFKNKVASELVCDFVLVKEIESANDLDGVVSTDDGDVIYGKSIVPNKVYHLTFKDKGNIITKELNQQNITHLILELSALINTDFTVSRKLN